MKRRVVFCHSHFIDWRLSAKKRNLFYLAFRSFYHQILPIFVDLLQNHGSNLGKFFPAVRIFAAIYPYHCWFIGRP